MKHFFSDLSVKHKLMAAAMLVSSTALLVAVGAFIAFEESTARTQAVQQLQTAADITTAFNSAGLAYNEPGLAVLALKSLKTQPDIVEGCVYDRRGQVFARYFSSGTPTNTTPPPFQTAGHRFDAQRLRLYQPIKDAGLTIGTIYLEEDCGRLTARLWDYWVAALLVWLASSAVALLLCLWLQSIIFKPLADLAQTVARVRTGKDYSVRATKTGNDELGNLIDTFNEMLAQIQERDANLERRVAERTRELAESLSVLDAILGATADGVLVVNQQGKKIFQNRRLAEMWKIPQAIVQNPDDEAQRQHVAKATKSPAQFQKVVAYYYAHPEERGRDEVELTDGTIMERMTAPVVDHEGKHHGRIWTFRDVTQSRKYEAALRESRSRFKFIFDSVPVGIASRVVYPDGRATTEINEAHLLITGLTRAQHEIPGIFAELTHPKDQERHDAFMRSVAAGKISKFSTEERYHRLDGTTIWVSYSYQLRNHSDGSFEELTTLVDITESKRVEAALRESEANYYSLVDQMPAGVFRKNQEGRFVFVNSWFCKFRAAKPEDFLGKLPMQVPAVVGGQDADARELSVNGTRHHQTIMETRQTLVGEEKYRLPDGRTVYQHTVKSPVFGPDGSIVGSQGILLDVTERKTAEAQLAYEREMLRTLMDSSRDQIYFKDLQSRFLVASRFQIERFGITCSGDLAGKSDFDFFALEHAQEAFEDEQKILSTGQPIVGKIEREAWKDGRKDTWVLTTKLPMRDRNGAIAGTFGISKDITELKEAQESAAREQARFKFIFDSVPVGISLAKHAPNGRLLEHHVNDAHLRICGLTREQNEDPRNYLRLCRPEDHRRQLDCLRQVDEGKNDQFAIETHYHRLDGSVVWVIFSFQRRRLPDGSYEDLCTLADITANKQAQEEREKLNRQLLETSRLAGMAEVATSVLHNVGNVLNSVNVSTTLVLQMVKKSRLNHLNRLSALIQEHRGDLAGFFTRDPRGMQLPEYLAQLAQHLAGEQAELTAEIELTRKNIEHIKDIVTMQQNYAKVSGVVETVKLTDLIEDALRMNSGALTRHQVEVARDYPAEVIEVTLERQKVLQILINLIRNAKYACDESGRPDKLITIRVRPAGSHVQILIEDNGVGIPAENMTRIFNHGFTTRENGHGFGLHSGALAARELGGSLTAASDGPGQGAQFILELPLQQPTPP